MRRMVKKLLICGAKSLSPSSSSSSSTTLPEEGRVRVYVGNNRETQCKLEMEANFLNHPLFEDLLRRSEDVFGHSYDGALRIACDLDVFLYLVRLLQSSNPEVHYMGLHELVSKFYSEKQF